jgi:hypothetical protein
MHPQPLFEKTVDLKHLISSALNSNTKRCMNEMVQIFQVECKTYIINKYKSCDSIRCFNKNTFVTTIHHFHFFKQSSMYNGTSIVKILFINRCV